MREGDIVEMVICDWESHTERSFGGKESHDRIQQLAPLRRERKVGARKALKFGENNKSIRSDGRTAKSFICLAISKSTKE